MTEFIHVEKWDTFQHYGKRKPTWIKLYLDLHHKDTFTGLTAVQRATLVGIWIEYPLSGFSLPKNTAELSRKLNLRVTERTLEALAQAGFIRISASSALSQRREEKKREEDELDDFTMARLERASVDGAWKFSDEEVTA